MLANPPIPEPRKAPPRPPMPGTLTAEEKWEKADLTDSFIFYKVMTENPDACRRLLERLLHVSIEKIEILGEKSLGIDSESKGIRLDVYVKDENRVFDVEMQVKNTGELPERARYYQGVMDVDMLKSGEPYRALKETHIIFICLKDIFGQGLAHYTFENLCLENPCIRLDDRAHKHFFAAENYDKIEGDRELKAFLKMLVTGKTEDTYTQELEAYTAETKQSVQIRRQYMDWARELNYEKERGYSIGYDSGYDSGLHQKALEDAANLLRANLGSLQQISDVTGLSLTEVEEIKNSLVCTK
ncbi:Rpn family recombination-promoting nuclease/putative transposase [Treponema berlinense]|uniref:Rpn family recombination-promoting nuclease/putative transposase n=1 Tax=Treponema berlinense TaxID=225004 RepID=UPI0026EC0650|nr:Rpn family recombination-promoting nuclease/putative transposase [Treponema berlinense]